MSEQAATLENPHPLAAMMPAVYQEDDFAQRLTAAFDESMAPVFCTLDNLDAYLDPRFAPEGFLTWLAEWVGLIVDETWSAELTRELIARIVPLYQWRGTRNGLGALVRVYAGVEPEIRESGAASFSLTDGGAIPGSSTPTLVVRVRVPDPAGVDEKRLDAVVAAAKPAHIPHRVEVVGV